MRPQPNDEGESGRAGPTVDRRTVLATVGFLGTAVGSGCIAGVTEGGRTVDEVRSPSDVDEPSFARDVRDEHYRLSYRWRALGRRWRLGVSVAAEGYRSATRASRSVPRCYDEAMASQVARRAAGSLSGALDAAGVESPVERLRAVTQYIRSLEYVRDGAATGEREYPKYVAQTLVEGGGDCEDAAFLLAGVLAAPAFGHEVALLCLSGHVGVGVRLALIETSAGPLLSVGGREYLYLDPTIDVPPGRIPESYVDPGVIAVYDGAWQWVDLAALTEHAHATFERGGPMDPRDYL